MALEDLEDLIDSLAGKFSALESPISSVTGALASLTSQQDAANNGLKQGRNALGHFTAAGTGSASALTKGFGAVADGSNALARGITSLGGTVMAIVGGPIPSATQAMTAVGQVMGSIVAAGADRAAQALATLGPEGEAAGAALQAMGAVCAATIGTLMTLAGTAIEVVGRVNLLRDSLAGLAGGAAAGASAGKTIDGLVASLPFARQQTEAWATSLLAVGEAGDTLAAHVKAIAAAQALTAVTGGQGGAAAEKMFKMLALGGAATDTFMKKVHTGGKQAANTLAEMGLNIKDLGGQTAVAKMNAQQFGDAVTKALQQRGTGALDDMGASWTNIATKAREGVMSLFDQLSPAVKPFMVAVKSLFGEFSKGGTAINILKPIVTAVFGALFKWGTMAVTAIHKGFLMVAIAALKMYIGMRPAIDGIRKFLDSAAGMKLIKSVLIGIAVVAALIALPFVLVGVAIFAVIVIVGLMAAAIGSAAQGISDAWDSVSASLDGIDIAGTVSGWMASLGDMASGALQAASDFVSGLVDGISAGAGAVVDAVKGLASGALGAFTGAFGIKSPSRVMLKHGEQNIAGATATGIDKGGDKVDAAMEGLGGGRPSAKGRGKGGGGGDRVFAPQFTNCQFGSMSKAELWDYLDAWWEMQGAAGSEMEPAS